MLVFPTLYCFLFGSFPSASAGIALHLASCDIEWLFVAVGTGFSLVIGSGGTNVLLEYAYEREKSS